MGEDPRSSKDVSRLPTVYPPPRALAKSADCRKCRRRFTLLLDTDGDSFPFLYFLWCEYPYSQSSIDRLIAWMLREFPLMQMDDASTHKRQ